MATDVLPAALSVYGPDGQVGTLYPGEPLSFAYCASWLAAPWATPLHPAIALTPGRNASVFVAAFFENLLPEGDQRTSISSKEHVSSVYGLLCKVGGESAGAFVLVPEGHLPQAPIYQRLTWPQVDALTHAGAHPRERAAIERAAHGLPTPRMSISGAQYKLLLRIDIDGTPCRPMGNAPSTHILKPDIVRGDAHIFASAANETIMMMLAHACGLPTAQAVYQPDTRACLVTRYDRERLASGEIRRIWQADFCQLLGVQSDVKYEQDGGPGFKDCYDLLKRSTHPGQDQRTLLRWLFFNLCTGNNDSHAKNLSMLQSGAGMRLAPFYDLMCTRVYPGLGHRFAFAIAGETDPGKIGIDHLTELARQLGIGPKYVLKLGRELATAVQARLPEVHDKVFPLLANGEQVLAKRIVAKTSKLARQLAQRIAPP